MTAGSNMAAILSINEKPNIRFTIFIDIKRIKSGSNMSGQYQLLKIQ